MGNNNKWIEINSVTKALDWFENLPETKVNYREIVDCRMPENFKLDDEPDGYYNDLNKFEHDSSPKAWEHYKKHYTSESFGVCEEKNRYYHGNEYTFKDQQRSYRLEKNLGYDKNRLYAVPNCCFELSKSAQTRQNKSFRAKDLERLGGDCDFNFSNEGKNWGIGTPNKYEIFAKYCEGKEKCLLGDCVKMHHTLLNFSLMQASGGLNDIKGCCCDYDRLDRFVYFLDQYFKTNIDDRHNTAIAINSNVGSRKYLLHYLNQFSNIYDYCAKIYFLPTTNYHTGMMDRMIGENEININDEEWKALFEKNQNLISDLLALGKTDFADKDYEIKFHNSGNLQTYPLKERVVKYMLLAVRFWQAKEVYFKLIDNVKQNNAK